MISLVVLGMLDYTGRKVFDGRVLLSLRRERVYSYMYISICPHSFLKI